MSWTKPLGWLGKSVTSLGPMDALGAGFDYAQGKEEGEDDVRAIAGAAGSTAGGWGGAMAGAALGTAAIPIPVVGTAVGAIAGSMLGGFAGGWGADRADELIRGKKGNTNDLGDVAKSAAGVGLLAAGGAYGLNKGKNMSSIEEMLQYEALQNSMASPQNSTRPMQIKGPDGNMYWVDPANKTGMPPKIMSPDASSGWTPGRSANPYSGTYPNPSEAVGSKMTYSPTVASGAEAAGMGARRVASSLKWPALIGGTLVAGTVANNMMGNPIGGAIDATTGMLTGGRGTDLKPNQINGPPTMAGRSAAVRDPYEDLVRVRGFANEREALEFQHQLGQQALQTQYDRKFAYDDYMNQQKINSDQALNMIDSYNKGMSNATMAANAILNAKWI